MTPCVAGVSQFCNTRRLWQLPFVDWGTGARVLRIAPGHLTQRKDALQPVFLEVVQSHGSVRSTGRQIRATGWCICPASKCSAIYGFPANLSPTMRGCCGHFRCW
jgi:hypothetical protein